MEHDKSETSIGQEKAGVRFRPSPTSLLLGHQRFEEVMEQNDHTGGDTGKCLTRSDGGTIRPPIRDLLCVAGEKPL